MSIRNWFQSAGADAIGLLCAVMLGVIAGFIGSYGENVFVGYLGITVSGFAFDISVLTGCVYMHADLPKHFNHAFEDQCPALKRGLRDCISAFRVPRGQHVNKVVTIVRDQMPLVVNRMKERRDVLKKTVWVPPLIVLHVLILIFVALLSQTQVTVSMPTGLLLSGLALATVYGPAWLLLGPD